PPAIAPLPLPDALPISIAGRALLVVDDRLDAAVEARRRGARVDGVHLGQSDASVVHARALLGPEALIGLTANTPAHLAGVRGLRSEEHTSELQSRENLV